MSATESANPPIEELLATLLKVKLEDVDAQISALEDQLREVVKPIKKQIAELENIRKIIVIRDKGRADRAKQPPNTEPPQKDVAETKPGQNLSLVDKVYQFLKVAGPSKYGTIAEAVGLNRNGTELEKALCFHTMFRVVGHDRYDIVKKN